MRRSKTLSKEAVVALVKDAAKRYAENVELKAKCERYEQGLKDLKAYSIHCLKHLASPDHEVIIKRVDEALSGEGGKH